MWKESDVFTHAQEGENLFTENICEMNQDDDVETDEEVLCSGIQQCHTDLRVLKQ